MKAEIEIKDKEIESFIKKSIDEKFNGMNIDSIIESKISLKISEIIKNNLSDAKIDNYARDRVSRIITTDALKDYTFGINASDVLSNLESKILLMIEKSSEFKKLVKLILKNSL